MQPDERRRRMRKLREVVEQNNVYRWGGKILAQMASIEFPEGGDTEQSDSLAALGVAV
jgi:trehalose-6-phosphate synthase